MTGLSDKLSQNGGNDFLVSKKFDNEPIDGKLSSPTEKSTKENVSTSKKYKLQLVWRNIILMIILHSMSVYGLYLYICHAHFYTMLFTNFTLVLIGMGVTCGAHRLWSHRSYEATLPLRIFLMILNSASLQNDIYEWSRDHRVHHKFSDTDADPHNSHRGFFFAHMGWLLCKKHPDVLAKGKTVSLSDLEKDPVVQFQRQFYKPLAVFFTFYLPTFIPYYCWGEDFYTSLCIATFRYCFSLHSTWLVNSAAHLYGVKPYDKSINPRESKLVQVMTVGEGYHNYHHVFPFDYSASEMTWKQDLNISTLFIDVCASLGLAKNLKKVDAKLIRNRVARTGDETLNQIYLENRDGKPKLISIAVVFYTWFLIPAAFYLIRIGVIYLYRLCTQNPTAI